MGDDGANVEIAEAKQELDRSTFERNIKQVRLRRLQLGKELLDLDGNERQYKEGIAACESNLLQIRKEIKKHG
ncbi:MAG: hypothetical protein V3R83_09730 [Gammaproteobacteria bacterium]